MKAWMLALALSALLAGGAAAAQEPPRFGRYMPLYPGQYFDLDYSSDDGRRSFDADGNETGSAAPAVSGRTALPRDSWRAAMTWHFPFFESYGIPFVSSRTWMGRITLRHARTATEGALADFIDDDSDDASTDADDLRNNGSGIGDMSFELGTYLFGSPAPEWRERERTPLALLLAAGVTANFGEYNRDAPVSAGANTPSWYTRLGLHWQPWPGGFVDAGLRYTNYAKNQDPAFGALAPTQQGDDLELDFSIGQRVASGWYLGLFLSDRDGGRNRYDDVRFAPNPPPGPATPNSDQFPTPGRYFDGGTALTTVGGSVAWFVTQRLRLDLSYTRPLAGESGAFALPYTERTPAGCTVGSLGCTATAGETIVTDGHGPARVLASDRVSLSLSFNFLHRDPYNCRGCSS